MPISVYAASWKHSSQCTFAIKSVKIPYMSSRYGITDLRSLTASWKKWHARMAERAAVKKVVEQKEKMKEARRDYIL